MSRTAAGPSMLDAFLKEILNSLRAKNGHGLTDLIQLDLESIPSARRRPYEQLNAELNLHYTRGRDAELAKHCKEALPQDEFGSFHAAFFDSIFLYFRYLRDFTTADNQAKAQEVRQLTSQCVTALGDTKYGIVMIPIVLSFSRVLATVATVLDRNPSLLRSANQPAASLGASEIPNSKLSFVEDAANVLRDAFIKCLSGSPGVPRTTKPGVDDKRIGIYLTANSCLKSLFQCRKLRNAQQMFSSIDAQSPLLSFYPAAQRVTYLYYLGRYHFANNHFYRAQLTLQAAYDQCHRDAVSHRRLILTYLITSNICLGRFPSSKLLLRREANPIAKYFLPLCKIIKSGDLGAFHAYLELDNQAAQWFLSRRILLQLRNRCEILVWRSLVRTTFIVSGYKGEDKKIPFLRLNYVRQAAHWSLSRHQTKTQSYVDPDFRDLESALAESGQDLSSEESPTAYEIESVFHSLIQQSLLRGFTLHANPRFAIPGAGRSGGGGVLGVGFPAVWEVVRTREHDRGEGDIVPGWVKDQTVAELRTGGAGGGSMAGRVVRLAGARPVGVGS